MSLRQIQRQKAAGFSLIETLTVLIIMGILTSFAIVVYGGYRRAARAKSAARQFENLFNTARALAINQNAYFQAVIDPNTSGLWIDQVDGSGRLVAPKVTTPEIWSAYVRLIELSVNGIPASPALIRILFRPNGTSDAARLVLFCEGGTARAAGEFITVKLYSPTARSRTFAGNRP